jgi:hypothetical protein
MPKTKTQAEKRQEREACQQAQEARRREQKAAHALEFQQVSQASSLIVESKPLSRKALRQQKKELTQEEISEVSHLAKGLGEQYLQLFRLLLL